MIPARLFWPLWFLSLAWVLLVVSLSIWFRRRRGKYLFKPELPGAIFAENWRSGRSLRNVITRLGGANHCLWVAVTPEALHVGAHFPFTLMFLPELYRLEHTIKAGDIRLAEKCRSLFGRDYVSVHFSKPGDGEEALELQVSNPDQFMNAVDVAKTNSH